MENREKTPEERIVFLGEKIIILIGQKEKLIKLIQNIIYELKNTGVLSGEEWAYQLEKDLDQALK